MAEPKSKRALPFPNLGKKVDLKKSVYVSTTKTAPVKPVLSLPKPSPPLASAAGQLKFGKNGISRSPSVRKSLTPTRARSRNTSIEPRESRNGKSNRPSRASPMANSPRFVSDDDEDDESEARRKRVRVDTPLADKNRRIRDQGSFSDDGYEYDIVHAADIANTNIQKHGAFQFEEFFKTLGEDEDDGPTIELQYPCMNMTERYQLVRPTDKTDFKPLEEIKENMRMVRDYYLDPDSADLVEPDGGFGGGLVEKLDRYARDSRPGAQTHFIEVLEEYNALLKAKREDGTIVAKLDAMSSPLPLKLVSHLVKEQTYARTVSPSVDIVREYEGFSDNVYGELLPKFLSRIFQETQLKSEQIFVDLGSGVGNCVLQAALEIGCDSWGCEVMPNPAKLAALQAREFPSRCRMWGIKPGNVHLIQGDFTENAEIRDVLKRADVVLVNNQAFTPALNDNLKAIFLDLKEGCQIVSLKWFRDPAHRVKESNINDLVNYLSVQEKERFSGMVSWTDDPGHWYISRKDSSELKALRARLEGR